MPERHRLAGDERTVNGFDNSSPNPLAAAAVAAYNAHPISQIPVGSFNVLGGLTYPKDGAIYQQTSHLISPRIGFAWTPLTSKVTAPASPAVNTSSR